MRLNEIEENRMIERLTRGLPRSDSMKNIVNGSDAEILDIGLPDEYIALTSDTIVEEISSGLYDTPYQIGWMVVSANLSDLAAVGAHPEGILLNHTIPDEWNDEMIDDLVGGVRDSCNKHASPVIGGDLNRGGGSFTGTCIGRVRKDRLMSRMGCSPGDGIYTTGDPGLGMGYAIAKLMLSSRMAVPDYMPIARLIEGSLISGFASSCIDTSDGLISALDQISRINDIGLDIESDSIRCHERVKSVVDYLGIPDIALTLGIHGDFELLYTIPEEREDRFLTASGEVGSEPIRIGTCKEGEEGGFVSLDGNVLPTGKIRNLWDESEDIEDYGSNLLHIIGETLM